MPGDTTRSRSTRSRSTRLPIATVSGGLSGQPRANTPAGRSVTLPFVLNNRSGLTPTPPSRATTPTITTLPPGNTQSTAVASQPQPESPIVHTPPNPPGTFKDLVMKALTELVDPDQKYDGLERMDILRSLGLDENVYKALSQVAKDNNCLIFIRATNGGILEGLEHGGNITGKTLATKGKSSRYLPIKANIAFFSALAKRLVTDWADLQQPPSAKGKRIADAQKFEKIQVYQQKVKDEQNKLLKGMADNLRDKLRIGAVQHPTFFYIPKLLPLHRLLATYAPNQIQNLEPDWIHLQIDTDYTCQVSFPPGLGWSPLTLNASGYPTDTQLDPAKTCRNFLWVKKGQFDGVNTDFVTRMGQVPGWQGFSARLASHQGISANEPFYQLYFLEDSVLKDVYPDQYWQPPQATTPPTDDTPHFLLDRSVSDWFQTLAPRLDGSNLQPPAGTWRIMPVLAQAKLQGNQIAYYEIVADFDVFAICPSIKSLEDALRGENANWEEVLRRYYPQVITKIRDGAEKQKRERGVLSLFEEDIRKQINIALLKALQKPDTTATEAIPEASSSGASSSSSVALPLEVESGPRFALHGCEVNNYFYTEKFDRLIFIRPDGLDGNRRFTFSADSFVNMACGRDVAEDQLNIKTLVGSGTLQRFTYNNPALSNHYLFQYNLQWNDNDHRPGETPLLFSKDIPADTVTGRLNSTLLMVWNKTVQRAENPSPTTGENATRIKQILRDTYRTILRLAFYSGYYHSLFVNLGQIHDPGDELDERRNNIRQGFATIRTTASKVRVQINHFYSLRAKEHQQPLLTNLNGRLGSTNLMATEMGFASIYTFLIGEVEWLKSKPESPPLDSELKNMLNKTCFQGNYNSGLKQRLFMELVYSRILQMEGEMQRMGPPTAFPAIRPPSRTS